MSRVAGGDLTSLTDFVLKAVQLGFLGFGALLFVMVFVILYRNQPADRETAKLRMNFLKLGVGAFVFAGVAQLATLFIQPRPVQNTAHQISVAFSPDFQQAKLPEPSMRALQANRSVEEDQPFTVDRDETLLIRVDSLIKQAQDLGKTASSLAAANDALTQKLAGAPTQTVAGSDGGPVQVGSPPPVTAAQAVQFRNLSQDLQLSLKRGDFAVAADRAVALNHLAVAPLSRMPRQ